MMEPRFETSPFGALETPESLTPEKVDARARALLARLSLDEKLALMDGDQAFWPGLGDMMTDYGSHPWVAGAVPRLGIPGIRFADGPRGVVMQGATTFPVTMARGATWDESLEERVGDAIGRELRALGGNHYGGVCVNLLRHPAWGRAQETYGEDTHHLGVLGAALTRGVQRHVMACVKHYALNSMENARFVIDVSVEPRALHEVYLRHFKRVVDAGVASVMTAYNGVNGEWCGQHRALVGDVLKRDWGFDGFVLTDFVFGMRDAEKAALAGQDLEMPFRNLFHRHLKGLVERGAVPAARVDDAALRLLRQQVRFAQGRDPTAYDRRLVGCEVHRQLAREVAAKSIVLLRNEGGLLPLAACRRLAVVGRLAASANTGDRGSSSTRPAHVVTPLEGLRAAVGAEAVAYDDGRDPARAAALAATADAVVVVVGYTHEDEGEFVAPSMDAGVTAIFPPAEETPSVREIAPRSGRFSRGGDRAEITLRPEDEALIRTVAAANARTIVVLMAGSAVVTEAWRHRVPAILVLWYPGMEGGHALADVLLGVVNPSGRLPCTFPASAAQLPFFDRDATAITYDLWHGYRKLERDGELPAFPFGFGLSYTAFAYRGLRLACDRLGPADTLQVTVDVSNTGALDGEEVVQLYVAVPESSVERAPRELKAFARVPLAAGETRSVRLEVRVVDLAYYDATAGWVVEPTRYEVIAGRHALDPHAERRPFWVDVAR